MEGEDSFLTFLNSWNNTKQNYLFSLTLTREKIDWKTVYFSTMAREGGGGGVKITFKLSLKIC